MGGRRVVGRLAVVALLGATLAGCAPSAPPPAGPGGGQQVVTVELTGSYEYAASGAAAAPVRVERDGGAVAGLRGAVEIPGRGAQPATVTFDLDVNSALGVVTGSIDVVDPAAGLAATTPMVLSPVTIGDGAISGSTGWQRPWSLIEFRPYELRWSIVDGSGAAPAATPAPDGDAGAIDVITYNVAGLPEPISSSLPATNSRLISPLLNSFDLVLLQEDFFYPDQIARHLTHPWGSLPQRLPLGSDPTRPSAFVGSGLERYARHPFDGYRQVRWPGCFGGILPPGAADCLSQKGFSVATHRLADGVAVDVYDLHAEAGSTPEDVHWSTRDYEELARYIVEHSDGGAVIVGGDFNLHRFDPVDGAILDRFLAEAGLTDVCEVADCSADPATIDRIAFRSGEGVRLAPTQWWQPPEFVDAAGEPLSDHTPTAARFTWERIEAPR